ncbi:MAG: hypothetical protein R3263_05795 [Myxococcota bacterium]|nr:hypothetical protein [Myxococcota bacterium]
MSRWVVAGVALLLAALAAWAWLRTPGPPHADIDERDRERLMEILREEEP